jgi:hypothetical protein
VKYHFDDQTLNYVSNVLHRLSLGEGFSRPQRRYLQRLSNKFAPPRMGVHLKPAEKLQVQSFLQAGMGIMADLAEKSEKQEEKDHAAKVFETLERVLDKLEGRKPTEYVVQEPTPEIDDVSVGLGNKSDGYEVQEAPVEPVPTEAPSEQAVTGTDPR